MHYRVDEKKYLEILTQFIDKENPPEYILLYEIRNRKVLMHVLDMFPNSKFYIVDEPYFIRLILKWPKKNYSKRILGYEMIQTEEDTKVEELKPGLDAILEKAGVGNLTVIMNPPYGYQNALVKPIINSMLECKQINEIICLAPTNAYKSCTSHIQEFAKVDNLFNNVVVENLGVVKLLPKEVNKFSFEDCMLEKEESQLFKSIIKYNEKKEVWCFTIGNGNNLTKRWCVPLKDWKNFNQLKCIENKTLEQLDKEKCIFYTTCWTPFDGVHVSTDCWDYKLNILNENYPEEAIKRTSVNFHIFKNKKSRDHFRDWWYSCNKSNIENKKQRIGLTNKILDIIVKMFSGSAGGPAYNTCFPNLDWSRAWTDEEIIQELKDKAGLPKDWVLKY